MQSQYRKTPFKLTESGEKTLKLGKKPNFFDLLQEGCVAKVFAQFEIEGCDQGSELKGEMTKMEKFKKTIHRE